MFNLAIQCKYCVRTVTVNPASKNITNSNHSRDYRQPLVSSEEMIEPWFGSGLGTNHPRSYCFSLFYFDCSREACNGDERFCGVEESVHDIATGHHEVSSEYDCQLCQIVHEQIELRHPFLDSG